MNVDNIEIASANNPQLSPSPVVHTSSDLRRCRKRLRYASDAGWRAQQCFDARGRVFAIHFVGIDYVKITIVAKPEPVRARQAARDGSRGQGGTGNRYLAQPAAARASKHTWAVLRARAVAQEQQRGDKAKKSETNADVPRANDPTRNVLHCD